MRLRHAQGVAAENSAVQYLQSQGCRILERNWHCKSGEIDVIALDGEVCVFVEVRMRRSERFGGAAMSITPAKQHKILLTAQYYLHLHQMHQNACRIDAILIDGNDHITWLKNILENR